MLGVPEEGQEKTRFTSFIVTSNKDSESGFQPALLSHWRKNLQPDFSNAPTLSHPLTKYLVHASLPACARAFEIRQHFGVVAHGDRRLGWPILRATLALAFLSQGFAYRAITSASYNNSAVARRPFFHSGRAIFAGRLSHHLVPLRRASGQSAR